jgi:hypothetical protein
MDDEPKLPKVYARRLSDKVLIAFDQACDQAEFDSATELLKIAETILLQRTAHPNLDRRKSLESIVGRQERLWHLRNPGMAA